MSRNYKFHNNPVASGFATDPVDWKYSSARNYQEDQTVLEIDNDGYFWAYKAGTPLVLETSP